MLPPTSFFLSKALCYLCVTPTTLCSQHVIPSTSRSRRSLVVVPGEIGVVAQFPRLDQVCNSEDHAEHDADACYDDVGDSEEGVLASDDSAGRDDDRFCSTVIGYVEVWELLVDFCGWSKGEGDEHTVVNVHTVSSGLHSHIIVTLSKLAECRQASQSHPDLESLVIHQIRVVVIAVVIRISQHPVRRYRHIRPVIVRLPVEFLIACPGNVGVILHRVGLVGDLLAGNIQEHRVVECIVKDGIRSQSAGVVCLFSAIHSGSCKGRAIAAMN